MILFKSHNNENIIGWMYHPDYLGNNEFISDLNGDPYQYFWYSAFGEAVVSDHSLNGTYDSPWRFNGKEFDPETGNYYYGARYYNPTTSIWLSVDPLAHEFPSWSPYHFVHGNPINLIDPTGMSAEDPVDGGHDPKKSKGTDSKDIVLTENHPDFNRIPEIEPVREDQELINLAPKVPSLLNEGVKMNAALTLSISFTSSGWGVAVAEPTPVGEMVMAGITLCSMLWIYYNSQQDGLTYYTGRPYQYTHLIRDNYENHFPGGGGGGKGPKWLNWAVGGALAGGTAYLKYRRDQFLKYNTNPQDNTAVPQPHYLEPHFMKELEKK